MKLHNRKNQVAYGQKCNHNTYVRPLLVKGTKQSGSHGLYFVVVGFGVVVGAGKSQKHSHWGFLHSQLSENVKNIVSSLVKAGFYISRLLVFQKQTYC